MEARDMGFGDLAVGQEAAFEHSFERADLAGFIQISGDQNPLHADRMYAARAGFGDQVLHGLLTSSLYSTLVGMYLPGRRVILRGIKVDFHSPAFPGDRLRVTGSVQQLHGEYRTVELKAAIRKDDGSLVSRATISVGVRDDG